MATVRVRTSSVGHQKCEASHFSSFNHGSLLYSLSNKVNVIFMAKLLLMAVALVWGSKVLVLQRH